MSVIAIAQKFFIPFNYTILHSIALTKMEVCFNIAENSLFSTKITQILIEYIIHHS